MRTALLMVLALAIAPLVGAAAASQTVWKWVDERGVTHYSDRAVPGATKIELSSGNRVDAAPAAASVPETKSPEPSAPGNSYSSFEIATPRPDDSIINTGGVVSVAVNVQPALRRGHHLHLFLDGRRVEGFPEDSTSFELKEVPRGSHTVHAVIADGRGTPVRTTQRVTFTVRQESIAKPPVGPALKPPPKPTPRAGNKQLKAQPTYAQVNGGRPAIDPRTNAPVVTKPSTKPNGPKPSTPKPAS